MPNQQPTIHDEFIAFADQLANMSGDIVRQYYGHTIPYEVKEDHSPVTRADKEVERALRGMIRSQYPTHGVIGEEFEPVPANSPYSWILDPIDGTKSFMIGRPIFGTLISLLHDGVPIVGVLDQPILGERWQGAAGYSTEFNSKPTKTRSCAHLDRAALCTTSPNLFDDNDRAAFERVRSHVQYTIYGGDCYSYGLIARGTVDVVLETGLKPYDFCALRPIIEGAGGIITDWNGQPLTQNSDGRVIACGDKRIHAEVLELVNS